MLSAIGTKGFMAYRHQDSQREVGSDTYDGLAWRVGKDRASRIVLLLDWIKIKKDDRKRVRRQ